jgi:hypothetical protein
VFGLVCSHSNISTRFCFFNELFLGADVVGVQSLKGIETFRAYINRWYEGDLQDIFFFSHDSANSEIKRQICSVLAGYVWDTSNPFVRDYGERALGSLSKLVKIYE